MAYGRTESNALSVSQSKGIVSTLNAPRSPGYSSAPGRPVDGPGYLELCRGWLDWPDASVTFGTFLPALAEAYWCLYFQRCGRRRHAAERVGRVLAAGVHLGLVVPVDQNRRRRDRPCDPGCDPALRWPDRAAAGDAAAAPGIPPHGGVPTGVPVHGCLQHGHPVHLDSLGGNTHRLRAGGDLERHGPAVHDCDRAFLALRRALHADAPGGPADRVCRRGAVDEP